MVQIHSPRPFFLSHSQSLTLPVPLLFFSAVFGTFGTTESKSNPNPHRSAHFLRNATSSLILS